ncbi:TetR/AcrR family transcriptional regulator [Microbacterium oryzae]|uniref:TetR/AcrR family transcriptional regulator n=1 Tax=Microbacterium oryzae TaxID=743009 RepID=A0A6I6DW21_9MICO|nr:TetR/AcrR family transcriptional regulator [Microbacterium oryzae]QGU27043.1 TetR/AcrR family transcriptional regulator [Microbacterium oryzae]
MALGWGDEVSRPPRARDKVLDAFEDVLREDGERAATLENVARRAGVSKGGLLYHFRTRDALDVGLLERMQGLAAADLETMAAAPEGPVHYFLATSGHVGSPFDRAILAVSRLAHGGNVPARTALTELRTMWAEAIRPHVRDEAALDLVLLVSDGLYINTASLNDVPGPVPTGAALEALIQLVEGATRE